MDDSQRDVYEYMLTQDEIQKGLTGVNATVSAEIAEAKCECYMYVCIHMHVHVISLCACTAYRNVHVPLCM